MNDYPKKGFLDKIKDFLKLFFSVLIFISIFSLIFIYSEELGETGTTILIILYLLFSAVLAIYFSVKSNLIGDKSYNSVMLSIEENIKQFLIQAKNLLIILWGLVKIVLVIGFVVWGISALFNGDDIESDSYSKGNMEDYRGSPTYRYKNTPYYYDDEATSNDESNDQATGFYGTETMYACNGNSGNCYDLDVDSDGENIERIYFPKGGWVDVDYSECDSGYCTVEDENGTEWELEYE